jgi:hypothetical protein
MLFLSIMMMIELGNVNTFKPLEFRKRLRLLETDSLTWYGVISRLKR